jgi:hypothetical protein
VYILRDVDFNFRVQKFVTSSVFASMNVGTKMKQR